MPGIPNDQLTTWSQIGAQATSTGTYATIKLALEADGTGYKGKAKTFLQGSYGNDTNIIRESDVDVVIRLDSIFSYDISALPEPQKTNFQQTHPNATEYTRADFKRDVLAVLNDRFKGDVEPSNKAVLIKARNNRRKADVLITVQHRKYSQYTGSPSDNPVLGISFFKSDGTRVVNYPTQHRDNLTEKNQATNEWFKHLIRIFKNARQRLIEDGVIEESVAPSYYIEGLLYNVPNANFGTSYESSMLNILRWLHSADLSKLKCANLEYPLLDANADVTWSTADCQAYIDAMIKLWNDW